MTDRLTVLTLLPESTLCFIILTIHMMRVLKNAELPTLLTDVVVETFYNPVSFILSFCIITLFAQRPMYQAKFKALDRCRLRHGPLSTDPHS